MRRYTFANQYLTGIHIGIQSGHAAEEMWSELISEMSIGGERGAASRDKRLILQRFAAIYKTWIVLNGGDSDMLKELYAFLKPSEYPTSLTIEPGLNDAVTAVSIIIPERLYNEDATSVGNALRHGRPVNSRWHYSDWEKEFLLRKAKCTLAA